MNISKTEKLLAARRRLKEFQQHKKTSPNEEQLTEKPKSGIEQSNDYNNKNLTENISHDGQHSIPEESTLDVPEFLNKSFEKNTVENNQNNDNISIGNNLGNKTNETHGNVSLDNNEDENVNLYFHTDNSRLNYTSNNIPTKQNQQLLEMASAVADVLTEYKSNNDSDVINNELECSNQFLTTCIEEQKEVINQLHIQLSQYHTRISELEGVLGAKDAEFELRLAREINPLKEQLQIHIQTTGILIAEKAELSAALMQSQTTCKQKSEELEKVSVKLKSAQLRVNQLDKELNSIKKDTDEKEETINKLNELYQNCRREKDDLELEISELKQKLNLKNTENMTIKQQLEEKSALLSLTELRIQQVTNSASEVHTLESQHHTIAKYEQEMAQMRDTLKSLSNEKEEASRHYQNYVRLLDEQKLDLQNKYENSLKSLSDLEKREESYIQRLSDLELQLQREREHIETLLPLQDEKLKMNDLLTNMNELTAEQEKLHLILSEKDAEIEDLQKKLQDLQEVNKDNVEASKLIQALESEQVGASRAVSQNQLLKQQLNEMHDAFVALSNNKLDLTEQLQAERSIGRKLNIKLNSVESEIDELKKQVAEKEEALLELKKEKLQNAQIADQIQHYQVQSDYSNTLQQELQNALITIENLEREKNELLKKLQNAENNRETNNLNFNSKNETALEESTVENGTLNNNQLIVENVSKSFPESFKKLEERFKETMEKVAELTDEKQKLEYLVMQLQCETETIGEYITLYQRQRAILKERMKEKEETFQQLIEQRNLQQEQLHKLKVLVANLIKKSSHSEPKIHENIIDYNVGEPEEKGFREDNRSNADETSVPDETTSQILDLLTEIKDCKDTCTLEPNFHPCPWCSGKLITV